MLIENLVPGVTIHAVRYQVCALPMDHEDAWTFSIWVEYRGLDRWAVTDGHRCLSATGEWDWEPRNSERGDDYNNTHRFTLVEAWKRAAEAAPHVVINGWTPADVLEHERKNRDTDSE